jgi:putative transcriptional regulator
MGLISTDLLDLTVMPRIVGHHRNEFDLCQRYATGVSFFVPWSSLRRRSLRVKRVSMRKERFCELEASVREVGAILRGKKRPSRAFLIDQPDVRGLRDSFQLSQSEFAAMIGISVKTLRNWEQGRRRPEGPARVLLQIAAKRPEVVREVVNSLVRRESGRVARLP